MGENCSTCKHNLNDKCAVKIDGEYCVSKSKYEPKEKPMENKVIFESEERLRILLRNLFPKYHDLNFELEISIAKNFDYIRKSAVEKAEEMYREWQGKDHAENSDFKLICKMDEAIQELKAEKARWRNEPTTSEERV